MKTKIFFIFLISILLVPSFVFADTLSQKMSGKILLQVEESGEGWYVDPDTQKRAYLGRPADAFRIMRELGLGIAHEQLQEYLDSQFPSNLSGKILLDVEENGEAYYVDPDTLEGYFLGRPKDAFQVMRERGEGISNENLDGIAVHEKYAHKNQGDQDGDHKYYEVSNVVDGDTIDVIIDGEEERIRMIGVDTPETKDPRTTVECFGKEASQKTEEELSGKEVRLEFDETQGERGKYGRLLVYVFLKDGTNFNKSLIKQGYAHEYTYNIPYKYQKEFKQAEDYARENEKGLWGPEVCGNEDSLFEEGEESNETDDDQKTETSLEEGKWYTSSYHSAKYYYHESCEGWQELSEKYLQEYNTEEALLEEHDKELHPECEL